MADFAKIDDSDNDTVQPEKHFPGCGYLTFSAKIRMLDSEYSTDRIVVANEHTVEETDRAFLFERTCHYCGLSVPYKSFPNGSICYLGIMACKPCIDAGKAEELYKLIALHETQVAEDYE